MSGGRYGNTYSRYGRKDDIMLEHNPYANIDSGFGAGNDDVQ